MKHATCPVSQHPLRLVESSTPHFLALIRPPELYTAQHTSDLLPPNTALSNAFLALWRDPGLLPRLDTRIGVSLRLAALLYRTSPPTSDSPRPANSPCPHPRHRSMSLYFPTGTAYASPPRLPTLGHNALAHSIHITLVCPLTGASRSQHAPPPIRTTSDLHPFSVYRARTPCTAASGTPRQP